MLERLKRFFTGGALGKEKKPLEARPMGELRRCLLRRVRRGQLVIPDGISKLPNGVFDGRYKTEGDSRCLVSVVVPGSVKSIGSRAFAKCENLERITLKEGVEAIGSNAFTGCERLKSLWLPASVRQIDGWAFYGSGLIEPVFSADGKTLVYYPQKREESEYRVPEGVEEIGKIAFMNVAPLTRVILPQSLKKIASRAFIDCGFTEITLPEDAVVEYGAFISHKHGIRIHREKPQNALKERLEACSAVGSSFLYSQRMKLPQEPYWREDAFRALAEQCAAGRVEAMEKMADEFFKRAEDESAYPFCRCAAQFWQVRAYLYGSERARRELLAWCEANPNARMTSPGLDERLIGTAYGETLNALGFAFFEPDREYSLSGVDAQGVVEVSSWESDDGPDEDGFGREEYYDWWYLTEYLTLPAGVGSIHSYSRRERGSREEKFQALHDQAAAAHASARIFG